MTKREKLLIVMIVVMVGFVGLFFYENDSSFKVWSDSEIVMKCPDAPDDGDFSIYRHDGKDVFERREGSWIRECQEMDEVLTSMDADKERFHVKQTRTVKPKGFSCYVKMKFDGGVVREVRSSLDFEFLQRSSAQWVEKDGTITLDEPKQIKTCTRVEQE